MQFRRQFRRKQASLPRERDVTPAVIFRNRREFLAAGELQFTPMSKPERVPGMAVSECAPCPDAEAQAMAAAHRYSGTEH